MLNLLIIVKNPDIATDEIKCSSFCASKESFTPPVSGGNPAS